MSGGLFGRKRYGLDLKGMFVVRLACLGGSGGTDGLLFNGKWLECQHTRTIDGIGWQRRISEQHPVQLRGGRYVYKDYGAQLEVMKDFKHCTVKVFSAYSDQWGEDGGFKIVMMMPHTNANNGR